MHKFFQILSVLSMPPSTWILIITILYVYDYMFAGFSLHMNESNLFYIQASLSLPGSPFNLRRGSRGSHQFTMRSNRRMVAPPSDRKPLVLSTYLDAQEHLPYADDSNAVTPMSEENGAMVVPLYYANLGT